VFFGSLFVIRTEDFCPKPSLYSSDKSGTNPCPEGQ
jgi:hypothetical protein